jgi:hypothetical protein
VELEPAFVQMVDQNLQQMVFRKDLLETLDVT